MKNLSTLLALLFFIAQNLPAQTATPTQKISGQILDKDTRQPLPGATVAVVGAQPAIGTASDAAGNFRLEKVPVGRVQLQCTYFGYEAWLSDPFVLNSAREQTLQIELVESAVATKEVVVTARKRGSEPLNEASLVSTRSFSVEETQRYAASANDPGRMAMGFPGVQPSRDSRSDIVVRNNSALGLAWRLEGVDIPNPNHFARRGTSGGGITIFSVSMLGVSDFSTGAFAAEYGNAYSGVFDIRFRKGNAEKRQHTFRAGMLGLDYSTEGPFRKGGSATYLVNYRYSTLGILNKLGLHLVGERVDNTFQDLSFNLFFPSKNKKHLFSIWGIGGLSEERLNPVEGEVWTSYNDYFTRNFDTNMGAIGATHSVPLGDDAYLKTSLVATGQRIGFRNDTISNLDKTSPFTVNDERYREGRLAISTVFNKKISSKISLKTGATVNAIPYNFSRNSLGDSSSVAAKGTTNLVQPFAQLRLRPTEKLTFLAGVHALFFGLNGQKSIEPRLSAKFQFTENQSFTLSAGLHGKVLPLGNYFTKINSREVNRDAGFVRAKHLVAAYDFLLGKTLRLHAEAYFQKLDDVPVAAVAGSSWSILNTIEGFAKTALVNVGTGENMGIDLSLEKSFTGGTFFLVGGSVSRSRYTDFEKREHPTAFDSGISGTFMGGKEWDFKNASTLQLGLKVLYNGGQRLTPLLAGQSVNRFSPEPLLDDSRAFSEKVEGYFRPDLRIAFRKNNPRAAWWIALDIQNVANRRNIDAINRDYDPDLNRWIFREQSGLTPVLSFQIDF